MNHQSRRRFLQTTGIGMGVSIMPLPAPLQANEKKPNIVLCMADDQGWGDMAYNGHPVLKTPHFDAMANESLRFDQFYAAAPVCSPTRGSVMTGRHPNRFGCFKWGNTLRPQEITIAEALKTAGYVTGHFGKWHLGSVQNGSPCNPGASGFDEWLSAPNFFDNNPILSREGEAIPLEGESSILTADAAIEFIRKHANGSKPFLAVVWFGSPHLPHEAAEEDRALYENEPEKLRHFYGEITGMDRAFGKLRRELRELNIHENTILWYCSDNGGLPNVGSTGGRGNKGQVYEGGLRVPAMLEWPAKLAKPKTASLPCGTVDIYPTLLDWVGVKIKNQTPLDGMSLAPLLDREIKRREKPLGFWDFDAKGISTPSKAWMAELLDAQQNGSRIHSIKRLRLESATIDKQYSEDRFPGHAAWNDWPMKLHRIENNGEVKFELYNLETDSMETNDLSKTNAAELNKLRPELEGWLASVTRSLNGKDYG